jgi:hypothetical protein
MFRPQKTLNEKIIKLFSTLALPALLCGIEVGTITARSTRRITAAEMKYMRKKSGYTWIDYKINIEIAKELRNHNSSFGQNTGLTYLLIQWSRVLLEKLTGLQLVKKFPMFYGT